MRIRDYILIIAFVVVVGYWVFINLFDWELERRNIASCTCVTIEETEEVPSLELVPNTMSAGH